MENAIKCWNQNWNNNDNINNNNNNHNNDNGDNNNNNGDKIPMDFLQWEEYYLTKGVESLSTLILRNSPLIEPGVFQENIGKRFPNLKKMDISQSKYLQSTSSNNTSSSSSSSITPLNYCEEIKYVPFGDILSEEMKKHNNNDNDNDNDNDNNNNDNDLESLVDMNNFI